MRKIDLQIELGFINFKDEVENNTHMVRKKINKDKSWGATVIGYISSTDIPRSFFDFTDYEVEVAKINVGDIINLRDEIKKSNNYIDQYDEFYLITNINDTVVSLENYTVARAYKAQIKMKNSIHLKNNILP